MIDAGLYLKICDLIIDSMNYVITQHECGDISLQTFIQKRGELEEILAEMEKIKVGEE